LSDDDNYDLDEYGEPKVTLPENYDDDYNEPLEDMPNDYLSIRNYIENKHEDGECPMLKQIQNRMKSSELTCGEIQDIVIDLGYDIFEDEDLPRSMWRVEFN
jgi:hypothetical protein